MSPSANWRSFWACHALKIVVIHVLAFPLVLSCAMSLLARRSSDVHQWLPDGFQEAERHKWFIEHFGADETAIVSWPGCTLDDPRVGRLASALVPSYDGQESPNDGPVTNGESPLFERAITGPQFLRILTSPPYRLSRNIAVDRLSGVLIGPDEQTCVVLVVSPAGEANRAAAIQQIYELGQTQCGLSSNEMHLGGPTVDGAAIETESQRSLYQLACLSACVVLLATWQRLRSIVLALVVFIVAIYSTMLCLTWMYLSGGVMNLGLVILPTLIFILAVAMAVHLVNYFRDAAEESGLASAASEAIRRGWQPCVLSAITTAVGFASLGISTTQTVRLFGIYAAAGTLTTLFLILVLLPSLMQLLAKYSMITPCISLPKARAEAAPLLSVIQHGVLRWSFAVVPFAIFAMALASAGLWGLSASVSIENRFSSKSRLITDYQWLEKHLGSLVPIEVVVRFREECRLDLAQRAQLIEQLEDLFKQHDGVNGTLSLTVFTPPIPEGGGARQAMQRALINRQISRLSPQFERWNLATSEGNDHLWRISARVATLSDIDYGDLVDRLHDDVTQCIATSENSGTEIVFTGFIPLMYKAQRLILEDLLKSFLAAFAVIGLLMMLVVRNVPGGLLVMLPNVFPFVVVFGVMGWLGLPVEIGAVTTASIALGITVDDTLHYLTWFNRGIAQRMSVQNSLTFAYQRCAGAMVNTTLICCVGVMVFSLSTFMPTVRFSRLLAMLLLAALVGDLVLLPAILASPLGRLLRQGVRRKPVAESCQSASTNSVTV